MSHDTKLYNDSKLILANREKKQREFGAAKKAAKPLKKSEELLFRRFEEDYEECASFVEGDVLTEEQMTKILKNCGFVMQVKKHDPMKRDMAFCSLIFNLLKQEGDVVSKRNLKAFLLVILGKAQTLDTEVRDDPYGGFDSKNRFKVRNQ